MRKIISFIVLLFITFNAYSDFEDDTDIPVSVVDGKVFINDVSADYYLEMDSSEVKRYVYSIICLVNSAIDEQTSEGIIKQAFSIDEHCEVFSLFTLDGRLMAQLKHYLPKFKD